MNLDRATRRWRRGQLLALALRGLGLTAMGLALAWVVLPAGSIPWLGWILLALSMALASIWLPGPRLADSVLLARHLDRVMPELEDSADLVNRNESDLKGLERLQLQRVERCLESASRKDLWPRSQVLGSLRFLVGGLLIVLLIWLGQARWGHLATSTVDSVADQMGDQGPEDLLSRISVQIQPPAYTGRPARHQSTLEIEVPEGSEVKWIVPEPATVASLVFPDREPVELSKVGSQLEVEMVARESGVYQVVVGGSSHEQRSPYARLVVIPDEPPKLRLVLPEERVTVVEDPGGIGIPLRVEAADEYGLASLELVTTLALGAGELVEFRERRRTLGPATDDVVVTLETQLELSQLGLERGSELYFFIEGRDRREPEANVARTATYIVRVPEERVTTADLGEGLPIIVPPEYFRSQRQIIIDTEKLVAERAEISRRELEHRSESLGFDQRALRMRYGTLLGEEFESGRPVEAGEAEGDSDGDHDDHDGPDEGPDELLAVVPADLVHFHDSAEIATFFTNEIRTQLKQVLAQMWDAEGELRVHRPEEALPYEYRALELLKDLQQRSRIYVQKVGFETPPLEAETLRLTGDLDGIANRSRVVESREAGEIGVAAQAIAASLQERRSVTPELIEASEVVRAKIASLATESREALTALTALDLWLTGDDLTRGEAAALEGVVWRLVPRPAPAPRAKKSVPDSLQDLYRNELAGEGDW